MLEISAVGVDSDRKAVKAAYDNGMRLVLDGLEFIHGDVLSTLDEVLSGCDAKRLMVLLDPPRRGVEGKVLDALLRYGPQSILYVSCAADTLARDLRKLTESDYQLESAQLFDMFPRTALFETVAYLKKT